jgi:hypothetical protein
LHVPALHVPSSAQGNGGGYAGLSNFQVSFASNFNRYDGVWFGDDRIGVCSEFKTFYKSSAIIADRNGAFTTSDPTQLGRQLD